MSLRFSNLLLLLRDVPTAVKFYGPEGLGMKVVGQAHSWAVLETEGLRISLQQTEGYPLFAFSSPWGKFSFSSPPTRQAEAITGYTPQMSFTVGNLEGTMMKMMQLGATLDGPVKYPVHGKVTHPPPPLPPNLVTHFTPQ